MPTGVANENLFLIVEDGDEFRGHFGELNIRVVPLCDQLGHKVSIVHNRNSKSSTRVGVEIPGLVRDVGLRNSRLECQYFLPWMLEGLTEPPEPSKEK